MKIDHPLTTGLIVVNVLIFVLGVTLGIQHGLIQLYEFSMAHLSAHQWYVFFTAGFLHSSWSHLLYNMFFLWVFGQTCEEELGQPKTLFLYFTAMITGSLFFGILFPMDAAIGASAAISGLVAAAILLEPGREIFPSSGALPIVFMAVLFLIPTMLNAFNLSGNTANIAHIGGIFAGAVLALYWDTDRAKKNMVALWPVWAGIGLIVVILLLLTI